jgi:hypothetical protein
MHSAEAMKVCVGAPIFIDERVFVLERKDSRDGLSIFKCNADFECFSKAGDKVVKPICWLRRSQMAAACLKPKAIEGLK